MAKINAPTSSGKRVNELIINQRLSAEEATRRVLGPISRSALPEGAQVIGESLNELQYRDAQGFVHTLRRDGDATSPTFGQIQTATDRPAVLPLTAQIPGLDPALQAAINTVRGSLSDVNRLAPLAAEDESSLNTISQAERDLITQESTKAQGNLIAGLYGRGLNESSLANDAAAAFSQALGIALGQQASGAAQRKLGLQQFLTQLGLSEAGLASDFIGNITGQETQRAGTSAQIGLGREQLTQQGQEAARNFMLEWEKFQASQNKSKLPGILSGIASLATAIPGVGPFIGAGLSSLGGLLGGKNTSAGSQYSNPS